MSTTSRKQQTQKRHRRLRRHLSGTANRPRLAVFRSNNHIYAQVINDEAQSTLCSASTVDKELRAGLKASGGSCDASVAVGELVAKRAIAKGIQQVAATCTTAGSRPLPTPPGKRAFSSDSCSTHDRFLPPIQSKRRARRS